jgi:hypothetical protein
MYEIQSDKSGLTLARRIEHVRFKTVNGNSKEQDLEDLIIRHPGLLNTGDFDPADCADDLLIIGRQPRTSSAKRADLFAIHTSGALVIIEIKRDAEDERIRKEAMEFQAIRYAAASRKMSVGSVVAMYAEYLLREAVRNQPPPVEEQHARPKHGKGPGGELGKTPPASWVDDKLRARAKAVQALCDHLADEGEDLKTEDDLADRIDPRTNQRIYLVAASYEPDVTSACAWLREHKIPIFAFQLRPYRIGNVEILERHRLIPPPELDDYLLEMASPSSDGRSADAAVRGPRTPTDKPVRIVFVAADGSESTYDVSSWKAALVRGIRHLVEVEKVPVSKLGVPTNRGNAGPLRNAETVCGDLAIETNASSEMIRDWLQKSLNATGIAGLALRIETASGAVHDMVRQGASGEATGAKALL